jgi:hypothetical protein
MKEAVLDDKLEVYWNWMEFDVLLPISDALEEPVAE